MPKKPDNLSQPPAALGYRMPAEWEPHEATWIAWPHNRSDWPGKFESIPWIYAEIVRYLARVERVNILVDDEAAEIKARAVLVRAHVLPEKASELGKPSGNVRFFQIPTDRVWTRDYGPLFVRRDASREARRDSRKGDLPAVAATAWRFNAWAKYNDWKLDAPVGAEIAKRLRLPAWQPEVRIDGELHRIVLEGGSIDVNGRGTLITTEECLLSEVQQRNPGVSREHLEEVLRRLPRHRESYLAGARHRRRRYPRTRRRHHSFCRRAHRGHRLRAGSRRSQSRAAQREFPLAEEEHGSVGQVAEGGEAAHARAGVVRGTAAAGQLCQLLHRQQTGACAGVRRSQRPDCAQHPG